MRSGLSTGVVALTAGAAFIAGLDNLVVTFALPAIQRDFGLGVAALSWTVNAYTFTFAVFMLAAAAVGERIGRRTAFQVGVGVFTAASAMVALAPGIEVLIIARAVQGVGAAILVPLSLTLLVQETAEEKRPMAIAIWSAAQGLATAIGPLIGGAIVQFVGWQWAFWINVPIGLLLLLAAPRMVRNLATVHGSFDLLGLVGLSAGMLALVIALTAGDPMLAAGAGALGLFILLWFLLHIRRAQNAVVDPRLLRSKGFTLTNVTALLVTAGMFGVVFLLTQYFQRVLGYEPLQAGLLTLPWTLLPVIAAPIAGQLVARFGTKVILTVGAVLQAASLVSFALVLRPDVPYLLLLPGLLLAGLGMGAFFAVLATQALRFVATKDEGIASGINNFVRELGVLVGVAALAAVFVATGGQADATQFTRGLVASLWVGAAVLTLAVVTSLMTPRPEESPGA
ncbi:MAG: DHA2 family efflux MFS transporter permease subunit [Propionibacteriaceae bacterium]|nr:DHA2 family efflux MFS transporter permease subunit [Propionibacteriaceae bacterium]